jgi:hypothetical protein
MSEWETFCDISYFDLWRVRRKNERGFNDGYHLQNGEEAKALVELLNRLERERDEAIRQRNETNESSKYAVDYAIRERDEARTELEMWRDGNIMHQIHRDELEKAERERDEARATLTDIHRWIDRNHPDGFIDSQTYFQNLERFVDNWYDRLDRLEVDAKRFVRERDEAREIAGRLAHFLERPAYSVDEAIARMEALNSYKQLAPL